MLELKIGPAEHGMDWLTFTASVVGSAAWPLAAVAIAFIFRKQIRALIARIRRLSVGENAVDFSEQLADAEVIATEAGADAPQQADQPLLLDDRTQQLIALSPGAAVLDTWRPVERKVKRLARSHSSTVAQQKNMANRTVREAAQALLEADVINSGTYTLILELSKLRNAAAHSDEITTSEAVRFAVLAADANRALDAIVH